MRKVAPVIALINLIILSSCEQPFEPKTKYVPKLVVYSVIDPRRSDVIVRLSHTYDPPGYDPDEYRGALLVPDASVTLRSGSGETFNLAETTLVIPDIHGNLFVSAYVLKQVKLREAERYFLFISAHDYPAVSASTIVPAIQFITAESVLEEDAALEICHCYQFSFGFYAATAPKGYIARLWIRYSADTTSALDSLEVPYSVEKQGEKVLATYPQLDRLTDSQQESLSYTRDAVTWVLEQLASRVGDPHKIRIKGITFDLLLLDQYLYNYYSVAHGFNDPLTVRTDTPDYSNIQGGLGVFGSLAHRSLSLKLPHSLLQRFNFIDDQ
ncbi:MAG: DUF4249 family protein [Bacteroidota bacterium]